MFRYLQQMPAEQQLLLGAFVAVLPFLTWAALLQRKYSIPFPLPQPLPKPLPPGWSTFILTFGLQLLVVSVFAAVAACRYYSYIGEMEKTGGRVIMLAVLSFAYDVGGRIGVLVIGLAIAGCLFWAAIQTIGQSRMK